MRPRLGAFVIACSMLAAPLALHAQADAAKAHFEAGVRLLDDSKFAGAAEELEKSLAMRESPPVLFNLGLAYRGLGRYKDAIAKFERFLALADQDRYAPQRARVKTELDALKRGLAVLTLVVRGGASQVKLDGTSIGSRDDTYKLTLDPGRHEIVVQRGGHRPVLRTVTHDPGQRQTQSVDASEAPLPARLVVEVDNPNADIRLDGKTVGRGRFDGRVLAGAHRLRVSAPNRDPIEKKLDLGPGETARQELRMPERDSGSIFGSPWFWAGSAVVVGAAVAGVILLQKPEPEEPRRGSLGVLVEALRR